MANAISAPQTNHFSSLVQNINKELHDKGFLNAESDEDKMSDKTSEIGRCLREQHQLSNELRANNFDVIRFATYRTASKLRFIQKKTNLHQIDVWNVIEAFRENGINSLDSDDEVNVSRLEAVLSFLFIDLNKRLLSSEVVDVDLSTSLLLNWFLSTYDKDTRGKISAFALKVALVHMCAGKLEDKLKYVFMQISDSGVMIYSKFEEYLKDLLALPTAVYEGPSFGFSESCTRSCFDRNVQVNLEEFLEVLLADPGPQCLMWLPILFRMSQSESVVHSVQCEGCNRESFMGFRYKCQQCYNYQLCQDCFWRGRTSANHRNDHKMKEYTAYKPNTKRISKTIQKSLHCIPQNHHKSCDAASVGSQYSFSQVKLEPNLPVLVHNGYPESTSDVYSRENILDSSLMSCSQYNKSVTDSYRVDDEHRLIARYAARLAADSANMIRGPSELNCYLESNKAQRDLVNQLEEKNREIMSEIQRLRQEQEREKGEGHDVNYNPTLLNELRLLRERKNELETRMSNLQESRLELMVQLEGLMKLLKNHGSPKMSASNVPSRQTTQQFSQPTHDPSLQTPVDTLLGVGSDVHQAFLHGSVVLSSNVVRSMRNELLIAADSITSAMSSLVGQLNSDEIDEDDADNNQCNGDEMNIYSLQSLDDSMAWQTEVEQHLNQEKRFLSELIARRDQRSLGGSNTQSDSEDPYPDLETSLSQSGMGEDELLKRVSNRYDENTRSYPMTVNSLMRDSRNTTDDESCFQTDDESYFRTDDEDGGNTDWEDAMKRWVNR